jgi:hypothetical protein
MRVVVGYALIDTVQNDNRGDSRGKLPRGLPSGMVPFSIQGLSFLNETYPK